MKLRTLLITASLSIFLFSFNSYAYNNKNTLNKNRVTKDSIWVFKSDTREVLKVHSNENIESNITQITNYHIINFSTSEIILFFARDEKGWKSQSFEYYSTLEGRENIEFNTQSSLSRKVYLDINPFNSIVYSLANEVIMSYSNLEKIDSKDINKLGIYEWIDSYEIIESSKKIVINELIKDFEYSEHWRTESFKKAVDFIKQKMGEESPKCEMKRRSSYNPNLVQYIGNQGLRVKLYAEYDCNQNYINQSYFWVDAYYLGYGKWSLELQDQKLTH